MLSLDMFNSAPGTSFKNEELENVLEGTSLDLCIGCGIPVQNKCCSECLERLTSPIQMCFRDMAKLVQSGIKWEDAEIIGQSLREFFVGDVLDEIANGVLEDE